MTARTGFSLIELLLATVLSVLLMMGVMAVVSDLAKASQDSQQRQETVQPSVLGELGELLRRDLAHADSVDASGPGRIVMTGQAGLDRYDRSREHRPVRVTYRIQQIGSHRWLIRQQESLDLQTNQNRQRDLICRGIDRLELLSGSGGGQLVWNRSRSEGPPDHPPAEGADPPEDRKPPRLATSRDQLDPYDSIKINGLNFYIKYAPRWALEQRGLLAPRPEPGDQAEAGEQPPEPSRKAPVDPAQAWRLRVWVEASDAPVWDRVVSLRRQGGP